MRGHVWFKICRGLAFMFCGRCGLINLKNEATHRAMRRACEGREDD